MVGVGLSFVTGEASNVGKMKEGVGVGASKGKVPTRVSEGRGLVRVHQRGGSK